VEVEDGGDFMVTFRMEQLVDDVRRLLDEKNFVGVGMVIRASSAPDSERFEALGLAIAAVNDALAGEKNRERLAFLRTMLSWYFKEAPGLSHLYREQLRMIHGGGSGWNDLSRLFRMIRDFGSGGEATGSGPDIESTSERMRDFTDEIKQKGEEFQDQVKDFFSASGIDLDEGMRRASEFFSGPKEPKDDREERDVDEEQ